MEFLAEFPLPPFRTLNTLTHCLLPFKVSDEKYADILIEDPFLCVTICFFLAALMLLLLMMSLRSLRLCLFFLSTFSLCSSNNNSNYSIFSSSSLILLLFDLWISLIRFLFHLLYWQLQIFFFVSFKFSISLLTFPFYLYIVVLTLSTSSFSSPSTFKTTVLKSLSSISAIRSFFTVSVYLLECTMLSCFLVCPVLLFVCLLV